MMQEKELENESKLPPFRTGIGFDIHRLVEGRPFLIGGIEIDDPRGPDGHSDGDPLLHAIADACLGAAGLGDIGSHFPDNDPSIEGISGDAIINEVLDKLEESGLKLAQVDSVVLLEEPRISQDIVRMKKHLKSLLQLPTDRVGVKAKSFEGMGPIGNKEAVGAWASVLLMEI